jgi:hypothetical protein
VSRKTFFVVFFCFILGMCMQGGLFAQEAFTWHLALVKDNQGLQFDKTVNMRNGERFSIEFFTEKDCYAYIIVEQASGEMLHLLSRQIKAGEIFRTREFPLGPPAGQELFYVVTSSGEQRVLQNAIDAFNKDKTDRNAQVLRTALFRVKDDNNPGKPVSLGGFVRGEDETIPRVQGIEYSGSSAYTKTIIISH